VAFYAYLNRDGTVHVNHTLIFVDVITNKGQTYDPLTGVFTCTVSGIYVFSQNIEASKNNFISTRIRKNGIVYSFIEAIGTSHWEATGYNSAILEVNRGDRVWVEVFGVSSDIPIPYKPYVSFSGFLLYRT